MWDVVCVNQSDWWIGTRKFCHHGINLLETGADPD